MIFRSGEPADQKAGALSSAISAFCLAEGLSGRECQIVELAAQGLVDKEISCELRVAYTTVKSYWSRIYSKVSEPTRQRVLGKLFVHLATSFNPNVATHARGNADGVRPTS